MSLSTESALDLLTEAAQPLNDNHRARRVEAAQAVLHDDLAWIEEALRSVLGDGLDPAKAAVEHLVTNGGKRIRPAATLLSAACFGEVQDTVRQLAVVVELVHSATLLHDDVIDEGVERRGVPTSRLLWGNAVSVLAGDVLLIHSVKRVHELMPALMPDLLQTLTALVSGEVVQLRGRSNVDVSEETYEHILRDKTASLFRFAVASAARLSGATKTQQLALGEFGERLGMAFQLVDDVLDYTGTKTGKTLCADLREGKVTLPLVLAARANPALLDEVKRVHAGDDSVIHQLQANVLSSGSCEQVRQRAVFETDRAIDSLRVIDESPAKLLLVDLAKQLTQRTV